MFYLMMHSTHFIYSYIRIIHMVKDHSDSERKPMGYSLRLVARVLLYAPSHRQDLCYTSHVALAGTGNSSWCDGLSWGGPIELFLVPASTPRLV